MSLRDRYLTLHGRKPVLEALMSGEEIAQLHISKKATGEVVQKIKQLAAENGVSVEIVSENRVAALTRSGQHQGVAADIRALKKPEPYKGKGIRYVGERIIRKAGKTAK